MAVVVNEFEVLASEPAPPPRGGGEGGGDGAKAPLDARDLIRAMRALEERALRAWAH